MMESPKRVGLVSTSKWANVMPMLKPLVFGKNWYGYAQ
jgi:hypothetical protein